MNRNGGGGSKTKFYEFTNSDEFIDVDNRVIYIAGATAKDWAGTSTNPDTTLWDANDNTGLVGALYNYGRVTTDGSADRLLSTKIFSGQGVKIVLDETVTTDGSANDLDGAANMSLSRREVRLLGTIGKELSGTATVTLAALKGLYMGEVNYMIGKHTIFGAMLDNTAAKATTLTAAPGIVAVTGRLYDKGYNKAATGVWGASQGTKDTAAKAEARYKDSLTAAWSLEVIEADLIQESSWMK